MASPFQQQSLQRKFVYFGLILALFTGSLLFRKLIINDNAEKLRLRSVDQGEVALTDTAMYLTLSGLRGVVVTYLWQTAIDHQKRHEWSELEAAVRSLTQLQPHYVSPWLFQSWNLAFNVSVECDRSRDKYFYISRGIQLLAEGERKNRGNEHTDPELRSPANPEMRYYVGFTYQLKIGQGDEKRTLRSLFDMSCIDPNQRRPEPFQALFKEAGELEAQLEELKKPGGPDAEARKQRRQGVEQRLEQVHKKLFNDFKDFCEAHPRLVRRLREQIGLTEARDVVNWLADNRELPSRFVKPADETARPVLLPPDEQFPVLPPRKSNELPDPNDVNFGGVETDVFMVTRAWYEYAQEPLPPSSRKIGEVPEAVPGRSRMPKMDQYVFRSYPPRAQAYVAEELGKEGWFDGEGWSISGRFADLLGEPPDQEVLVGKNKLSGRLAWGKAYQMYLDFGAANGLYVPDPSGPPSLLKWEKLKAEANRHGPRSKEAREVSWLQIPVQLTAYYDFLEQARAESKAITASARRKFYQAELLHQEKNIRQLGAYRDALNEWVDVALQFPVFAQNGNVQEEIYEVELNYMRMVQKYGEKSLKEQLRDLAQDALWPPRLVDLLEESARLKRMPMKNIVPSRQVSGPLELLFVFTGKGWDEKVIQRQQERVKAYTLALAQASLWPPLPPQGLRKLLTGEQERRLLVTERWPDEPPGVGWLPVIGPDAVRAVRDRLGINTPQVAPNLPPGALPPGVPAPPPPPGARPPR
jgi:hypothetical protein